MGLFQLNKDNDKENNKDNNKTPRVNVERPHLVERKINPAAMRCVYAGPEEMRRMRNKRIELEDVYAGPALSGENLKPGQEVFSAVYAAPAYPAVYDRAEVCDMCGYRFLAKENFCPECGAKRK